MKRSEDQKMGVLAWMGMALLMIACGTRPEPQDAASTVQATTMADTGTTLMPLVTDTTEPRPGQQGKDHIIAEDVRLREHRPQSKAKPCLDISEKKPKRTHPGMIGHCASVRGWWGIGAVLVPELRNGMPGHRVLRPFSFVREPNPSLGYPSWYALDALIIDAGWVAAGTPGSYDTPAEREEQLFREPVTVHGILLDPPDNIARLWEHFDEVRASMDLAPYGVNELPIILGTAMP